MEYCSEIWGDISKTINRKLDTLEHEKPTSTLDVNKMSKRSEVNWESE